MRKTAIRRWIGATLVAAVMAVAIGAPVSADDDRPRQRDVDWESIVRPGGVEWTRLVRDGIDGVEWTRLLGNGIDGVEWTRSE